VIGRRRAGGWGRGILPTWELALVATLLLANSGRTWAQTDRPQTMADFLDRLGLVDLQILHLERLLQEEQVDAQQQLNWARRLGDLYAGQLIDHAEDQQRSAQILEKIQALTQRFPTADTPALQVMLLQADYNLAESLVVRWISDPVQAQARDQALEILQRIAPELHRLQQDLNARVDARIDAMNELSESPDRDTLERQVYREQAVAGRATYFAGWANYYHGLIQGQEGRASIQLARDVFRRLLDIRADEYASLDAQWLGLESVWRCRALIGLGLCEAAIGELERSRACFALLQHASVPPEIQDQAAYWYLQGLLNAARYDVALAYAQERVANFAPPPTQGKISICVSLVEAAQGGREQAAQEDRRQLGIVGLEGLARLGQQQTIERLMERFQIPPDFDSGFLLTWSAARTSLAVAEKSGRPEDYRTAIERLEAALQSPDAVRHSEQASRCRYELAWCWFQLEDYQRAAQLAQLAWTGLKPRDPQAAAQAAWLTFASYHKASEDQPQLVAQAIDVLQVLKRDFPNHADVRRAESLLDRLQRRTESEEDTIGRLQQISPDDPKYLASQYELCLLQHQVWHDSSADQQSQQAKQVILAARRYLDAAGGEADELRAAKCCLLAADAAMRDSVDQGQVAAEFLDHAARLVDRLPENSPITIEYHYRRMQLAALRQQDDDRLRYAQWLVQHAAGTDYELPALVIVARAADQMVQQSAPDQHEAAQQQAQQIYQRLSERLGTSLAILQTSPNARVSLSRQADYAMQLGQFQQAADQLEQLIDAFPTDRNYLRRAAIAQWEQGDYAGSLERWRALLAGTSSGTEPWYEAKYYQILCLLETDPEMARKVAEQFRLLDPELGSPPWRGKFQDLLRNFLK
jgi:tetratricopeptide (TPR) repeat protein